MISIAVILLLSVACTTEPENTAPIAMFTVTPAAGTIDTVFVFDARDSADQEEDPRFLQVRWDWDGDGYWDTLWGNEKDRSRKFSTVGIRHIVMEVRDSWQASSTTRDSILVGIPVLASFTCSPQFGTVDTLFSFDTSSSANIGGDDDELEYSWDWESDGSADVPWTTDELTTHLFPVDGEYPVRLTVRNAAGFSDTTSTLITVFPADCLPTAAFSVTPDSGSVATLFSLDASGCTDPQDPTAALQVRWDFKSDGTWDTTWSLSKTADCSFVTGDTHDITLQVRDTNGLMSSTTHSVIVTNASPIALFTVTPGTGTVETQFQFNASASSDPDGVMGNLVYQWDFNTDDIIDRIQQGIAQTTWSYSTFGEFTIRLWLVDPGGATGSTTAVVSVENTPPDIFLEASPTHGSPGASILFSVAGSSDLEDPSTALQARWDWNDDGTWDTNWLGNQTHHTFDDLGTQMVGAQIRDTGGLMDSTTVAIDIHPPVLWSYSGASGTINSGPAIADDGTIYFGSEDALIHGVSSTGSAVWFYQTGDQVKGAPSIGADGRIYVNSSDQHLYAFGSDRSFLWRVPLGSNVGSTPAVADDGTVYVAPYDGSLWAVGPGGSSSWRYEPGGGNTYSSPSIASDGTIYYGSDDGLLFAVNPDGTLKWQHAGDNNNHVSPAIGANGVVYFLDDYSLRAVDPNDGSLVWQFFDATSSHTTGVVIGTDGTLYTARSYRLFAINPDGTEAWRWNEGEFGFRFRSAPTVGADGTIYIGGNDNRLYAFDTAGNLLWRLPTGSGGDVRSAPAIAADGVLYYGDSSNNLIAVQTASFGLAASTWPRFQRDNRNSGKR